MTVPSEIATTIISHLHVFLDRKTLLACSLVSPTFLDASQRKLYEYVTIIIGRNMHKFHRLSRLVDENPKIGGYVRFISIRIEEGHDCSPEALRMFSGVKTIRITANTRISAQLHHALRTILQLPTLETVILDDTPKHPNAFPMDLLCSCKSIQKLVLRTTNPFYTDSWESLRSEGTQNVQRPEHHLQSLLVENSVITRQLLDSLDHPAMTFSLSRLSTLITAIEWYDNTEISIRQTQFIFGLSALSLQEVALSISAIPWPDNLDLAPLVSLRNLRLTIERMNIPGAVAHVCDILKTIPKESVLERVTFRLIRFPYKKTSVGEWYRIDAALTRESHASKLRLVAVHFVEGINQEKSWLSRHISSQMTRLYSKGMLRFSIEDEFTR